MSQISYGIGHILLTLNMNYIVAADIDISLELSDVSDKLWERSNITNIKYELYCNSSY